MSEIVTALKALQLGARYDNFRSDGALARAASITNKHSVDDSKSLFVPALFISGSLVSANVTIKLDDEPLIATTKIAPIELDGQLLEINRWVEDHIKVDITNNDDSERVYSYTFPYLEISTNQKANLMKALGVL